MSKTSWVQTPDKITETLANLKKHSGIINCDFRVLVRRKLLTLPL